MYYSRRLTILQTNIDHAPVDGLKHLRTVNCRNRKRIKMDKLTDRPAGKRTNKPTDERMTEERERGGGGVKEREGERDRKSKELELYQKNRAYGFSIIQENSMFSLFT